MTKVSSLFIQEIRTRFNKTRTPQKTHSARTTFSVIDNPFKKIGSNKENFLEEAIKKGYKADYIIESSKANYSGCDDYSVEYHGFKVTIKNKTKGYTLNFDLYNYVSTMNDADKIDFLKRLQKMPGEALEDLYYEADRLFSSTGVDMNVLNSNPDFVAGGYYDPKTDKIITGSKHIVHELGHALDFDSKGETESLNNKAFCAAFNEGMKTYLADGNLKWDYKDERTWYNSDGNPTTRVLGALSNNSNYCTANPKEMFAEIYTLLMTGHCKSEKIINKYFSKCLELGKVIISKCRARNAEQRHHNFVRRTISAFV